ncbi:RHS repeat-associated core domain-containing protein, partial [Lonsdalea quercina]
YDAETGLYYNRHRYYDADSGQYISPDPIGLAGGIRPQGYVHNPLEWVDPLGLIGEKPLNSPDPTKWINKGGTVWNELDGTWVYKNSSGTTVRYPNGYPDFSPHSIQQVDVPDLTGNHGRGPSGDFGKADALAPKGAADYTNNTWHHHQNGKTMQEVPKDVHSEFTHRGGVSNIKNKKCG